MMNYSRTFIAFIVTTAMMLFGCSERVQSQYHDYAGAVHMHTVYSDGSGDFDRLVEAANEAGVRFIITSDHNTLKPLADEQEGWRNNILVLVGIEISLDAGHLFAMNLPYGFSCQGMTAQQCINNVNRAGGLGFLAHPVSKWEWKDWSVTGYTGMEIVNLASLFDDTVESYRPGMAIRIFRTYLRDPNQALLMVTQNRPTANLDQWDEVLSPTNKVVGIGASDAHERVTVGGRDLRVPRYEESFRAVQTHILANRELTGNFDQDKQTVYSALQNGRAYVAYSLIGNPRGTSFSATSNGQSAIMGQAITLREGQRAELRVEAPNVTGVQIRLLRNSEEIQRVNGRALTYRTQRTGVYRAEIFRNYRDALRPWVFTNPIYIRQ